jgi:Flp pilus assembly protein TadB
MAKERARRRAERERQSAARAEQRAVEAARAARRRGIGDRLRSLRPTRRQKPGGVLAARRRARNRLLGAVVVGVQVVGWVWARSWAFSAALLVFTVLATPALARLLLDRRD